MHSHKTGFFLRLFFTIVCNFFIVNCWAQFKIGIRTKDYSEVKFTSDSPTVDLQYDSYRKMFSFEHGNGSWSYWDDRNAHTPMPSMDTTKDYFGFTIYTINLNSFENYNFEGNYKNLDINIRSKGYISLDSGYNSKFTFIHSMYQNAECSFKSANGKSDMLILDGLDILRHNTYSGINNFKYVTISNCTFNDRFNVNNWILPKEIALNNLYFSGNDQSIDFTNFIIQDTVKCLLNIINCDVSRMKIDYSNFKLKFENDDDFVWNDANKEILYTALREVQLKNGFAKGLKRLDIEFKKFEYSTEHSWWGKFKSKLDELWWNFGYDKQLIIRNSIALFLCFFILNLFFYKELRAIYLPKKFKELEFRLVAKNHNHQIVMWIAQVPAIFLYTAFLFWGLKLDLNEIELKKPLSLSLILIEYAIGIICLAYIANYILSR